MAWPERFQREFQRELQTKLETRLRVSLLEIGIVGNSSEGDVMQSQSRVDEQMAAAKPKPGSGVRRSNYFSSLGVLLASLSLMACAGLKTAQRGESSGKVTSEPISESTSSPTESAVTSTPANFPSFTLSSEETRRTGMVFAWTFTGSTRLVGDSGCRLRLRQRETGREKLLQLKADVPVSVQALEPGTWDAQRLGCGVTRLWEIQDLFRDGIVVKANSVSVVGWFVFDFDERTLRGVREAGREENTRLAASIAAQWPSGTSKLISGFSGKELPKEIESRDEIVRVKAIGLKQNQAILEPLLARLQACASGGIRQDPLRAGRLRIEAQYRGGAFVGAKSASSPHALRDDLVACFLGAHENFQVEASAGDFMLDTTY